MQGAQRVEGDEPVVRADLDPQVAIAPLRVEPVRGEVRQRVQGRGRRVARPVRSKKEWPKPKVTVRDEGPASRAIPLSAFGAVSPAISRRAVSDQRRISAAASVRPAPGARSKASTWPLAWSGVMMPA